MSRALPTQKRRTFASDDELEGYRKELAEWGWKFRLGRGGNWFAEGVDGLVTLTDRNPKRCFHLTMGHIAGLRGQWDDHKSHQDIVIQLAEEHEGGM